MAAVGLADLLEPMGNCTIEDRGQEFAIQCRNDPAGQIDRLGQDPGYEYLVPNAKEPADACVPAARILDYPQMRDAAVRYREAAKKAKKESSHAQREIIEAQAPRSDFYLYQTLNTLQGDGATNKAFVWVVKMTPAEWEQTLSGCLSGLARRVPIVPDVNLELDLVQLFNPQAAKGYARLKPDSTGRGDKTKDTWGQPFLEWLRFRGYFQAACTFGVGPKREHIRILYPIPKKISRSALHQAAESVRTSQIFGSNTKIDCLGVLRIAQFLISHGDEDGGPRRRPAQEIGGVSVTHYQSLGSAKAVTSIEELALPDWFENTTASQRELWTNTLQEHFDRLRILRDENSDELALLRTYRQSLEARGDASARRLFDFLEGYGVFVMRQRGQSKWYHRQFETAHLEAIVAQTSFSEILANPGFIAMAAALRSATVSAQFSKKMGRDHRDIRYDILPELRRKRALPGKAAFAQALSEFVTSYNAESAKRLLEPKRQSGVKRITTDEWSSFLELLDRAEGGAGLVGSLLTAYATCRETREPEEADPATETEEAQG